MPINNTHINYIDKINNLINQYNEIVINNRIIRRFPVIDFNNNFNISQIINNNSNSEIIKNFGIKKSLEESKQILEENQNSINKDKSKYNNKINKIK